MYAVIFKANIKQITPEYTSTAARMRELAFTQYNCIDFFTSCENGQEIAVSYWSSQDDILAWRNNPEHEEAQAIGKALWYESYDVQVVEVLRRYQSEQVFVL